MNDNHVITKAHEDQFHINNERNRRDLGIEFYDESTDSVKNNQDSDLNDNTLTNSESLSINRNPKVKDEVPKKMMN